MNTRMVRVDYTPARHDARAPETDRAHPSLQRWAASVRAAPERGRPLDRFAAWRLAATTPSARPPRAFDERLARGRRGGGRGPGALHVGCGTHRPRGRQRRTRGRGDSRWRAASHRLPHVRTPGPSGRAPAARRPGAAHHVDVRIRRRRERGALRAGAGRTRRGYGGGPGGRASLCEHVHAVVVGDPHRGVRAGHRAGDVRAVARGCGPPHARRTRRAGGGVRDRARHDRTSVVRPRTGPGRHRTGRARGTRWRAVTPAGVRRARPAGTRTHPLRLPAVRRCEHLARV